MMINDHLHNSNALVTNLIHNNPPIQRLISASIGSILTSLLVTPLDVVKTRLQSTPSKFISFYTCPVYSVSLNDICCRQQVTYTCPSQVASTTYTSTLDAIVKITRYEGILALWKGLVPTLMMAMPANVIYFMGYEGLRELFIQSTSPNFHPMAPLLVGAVSRTIAVSVISPLELLRTQIQSVHAANQPIREILNTITLNIQRTGYQYLWRGLSITLARDVPFSGLYWWSYEYLKQGYRDNNSQYVPFVCGACAGMFAAALTTPLDVVKTRVQVQHQSSGGGGSSSVRTVGHLLTSIAHKEGWKGLFAGVLPRCAKVAPACAIMIGSYVCLYFPTLCFISSTHLLLFLHNYRNTVNTTSRPKHKKWGVCPVTLVTPFGKHHAVSLVFFVIFVWPTLGVPLLPVLVIYSRM